MHHMQYIYIYILYAYTIYIYTLYISTYIMKLIIYEHEVYSTKESHLGSDLRLQRHAYHATQSLLSPPPEVMQPKWDSRFMASK